MGTLTTGKELRFAVVVWAKVGGADTALTLSYFNDLKLSDFSSLFLLYDEPAEDFISIELLCFFVSLLLPLLCVPSEKRSEMPGFEPML